MWSALVPSLLEQSLSSIFCLFVLFKVWNVFGWELFFCWGSKEKMHFYLPVSPINNTQITELTVVFVTYCSTFWLSSQNCKMEQRDFFFSYYNSSYWYFFCLSMGNRLQCIVTEDKVSSYHNPRCKKDPLITT